MDRLEFLKLKKYDLVVVDNNHGNVLASVNSIMVSDKAKIVIEADLVICKVLKVANPAADPLTIEVEVRSAVTVNPFIDKFKLDKTKKNKIDGLTMDTILKEANTEDLILSVEPTSLTALDKLAIVQPAQFLQKNCGNRWLPDHKNDKYPSTRSVRDFFNTWKDWYELNPNVNALQVQGLSKSGGMRAMQEYRSWISQRLLEQVVATTLHYSKKRRQNQAPGILSEDNLQKYVDAILEMEGDAPGSTEPTSDIDVNTKGDGTEYGVKLFNYVFRSLFNDEPGIVFDVNLYGKDFLPGFDPDSAWERTKSLKDGTWSLQLLVRPEFDHEFVNYNIELKEADNQLMHAFTKLRRYMPATKTLFGRKKGADKEFEWKNFKDRFRSDHPVSNLLDLAEKQHYKWSKQILDSLTVSSLVPIEIPDDYTVADDRLNAESILSTRDPAELMMLQNRYYEYVLSNSVEPAREKFNLAKFQSSSHDLLDVLFFKLHDAMSASLYFANEAYVTAGAVLQVVGGKQKKSKGVEAGFTLKDKKNNIAYTPHELMESIVDNLADIHKEGRRHFAHNQDDIGGSLIACGKYIHRLLNAAKHLYWLYAKKGVKKLNRGFPNFFIEAPKIPKVLERPRGFKEWETFRMLGFALEAIKKLTYNKGDLNIENVATAKLKPEGNIYWLLINKFCVGDADIVKFKDKDFSKEDIVKIVMELDQFKLYPAGYNLSLTNNNNPLTPLFINDSTTFFLYFDFLAENILKEYYEYRVSGVGGIYFADKVIKKNNEGLLVVLETNEKPNQEPAKTKWVSYPKYEDDFDWEEDDDFEDED